MNKITYKISGLAYFLLFIVSLIYNLRTEQDTPVQLTLILFILFASIVMCVFGFGKIKITLPSKIHLIITWMATGTIIVMGIWAELSGACLGEGGMGCAVILLFEVLFFIIAQLVGLVSLISLGINHLKK